MGQQKVWCTYCEAGIHHTGDFTSCTTAVVAGEDGPCVAEMSKRCAEAGFGKQLPEDYSNGTPVVVAGYLMPHWMAEVLGAVGRKP